MAQDPRVKCGLRACNGCDVCSTLQPATETCQSKCGMFEEKIKRTKTFCASCKECAGYPVPIPPPPSCRSWCYTMAQEWPEKCGVVQCAACDECAAKTDAPTAAPTPYPTAAPT